MSPISKQRHSDDCPMSHGGDLCTCEKPIMDVFWKSYFSKIADLQSQLAAAEKRIQDLEEEIQAFQCSAMLGVDGEGIRPEHIEREIISVRSDLAAANKKIAGLEQVKNRYRQQAADRKGVIDAVKDWVASESDKHIDGYADKHIGYETAQRDVANILQSEQKEEEGKEE